MSKVLLGMSGGLDSTYAARLLMEAGHTVEGAVLRMHAFTETEEAEASAASLGIPIRVIDAEAVFSDTVIRDFCEAYRNGRTPNPCVICNESVKFRLLYEEAEKRGFDHIATGHYAKICQKNGRYTVLRGDDSGKDQSYMLYRLPQHILAKLLLPLGSLHKKNIRENASKEKMHAADREESQEICFVRNESYAEYIERLHGKAEEGSFVDPEGRVLGRHKGIVHYTVGQRKGLGISAASRLFIQEIKPKENEIVLADAPRRASRFLVGSLVFSGVSVDEITNAERYLLSVRYQAKGCFAVVKEILDGRLVVEIDGAPTAVTPGQSAVFYKDDAVAFGGLIEEIFA